MPFGFLKDFIIVIHDEIIMETKQVNFLQSNPGFMMVEGRLCSV